MTSATATLTLALALSVGPIHIAAASSDPKPAPKKPDTTATAAAGDDATTATVDQSDDPDKDVNRAQPDFTLIGLPTTLRLPRHGSAFRITHRFGRPLGQGDFSDLAQDFFGFDSGAVIGFEYRYGLFKATQLAVHRTNDRTVQFMLEREVKAQDASFPFSVAVVASAEGTNNFRDSYTPALGVLVSRELGDRVAIYAEPFWVNNTNVLPKDIVDDNDTIMVGLGARLRLSATVYGVFEVTPRVTGYEPGEHQVGFALEKRAGGHSFQINFGNAFGTTFGQMARGGTDDWYMGFNISRKFY